MANSILDSHYNGTSNTILVSHNWPSGASANGVLASHDADYPAIGPDVSPNGFSLGGPTSGHAPNATQILSDEEPIANVTAEEVITFNFSTTSAFAEWRKYNSYTTSYGSWNSAASGTVVLDDTLHFLLVNGWNGMECPLHTYLAAVTAC